MTCSTPLSTGSASPSSRRTSPTSTTWRSFSALRFHGANGRHQPVLGFGDVPSGIWLQGGPFGRRVVGRVRLLPGLRAVVPQDPDKPIPLIDGPATGNLEPVALPKWGNQPLPFVDPGGQLTGFDRVYPQLILHRHSL